MIWTPIKQKDDDNSVGWWWQARKTRGPSSHSDYHIMTWALYCSAKTVCLRVLLTLEKLFSEADHRRLLITARWTMFGKFLAGHAPLHTVICLTHTVRPIYQESSQVGLQLTKVNTRFICRWCCQLIDEYDYNKRVLISTLSACFILILRKNNFHGRLQEWWAFGRFFFSKTSIQTINWWSKIISD